METSSLFPSLLIFLANSITMEKLVTVGLKKNKLRGGFPEELSRFKKLQLDVQGKTKQKFFRRDVQDEVVELWTGGNLWI